MTTWYVLTTAWDWEPSIVLGCAGLVLAYGWVLRWQWSPRAFSALAGLLILLFALVSPLDTLGDNYLFSAHMLQHLLLVLVVPPLLLIGVPNEFFKRVLAIAPLSRAARLVAHPVFAWLVGVGTVWVWHLPWLYDATLTNGAVHIFEHLTFLVSATIFWSPALVGALDTRLSPIAATVYFMSAGFVNCLLGVLLANAPQVLYQTYLHPTDVLGILPLVRGEWGLDPRADQRLAGDLMWVPGAFPYIIATFVILARWFAAGDGSQYASIGIDGRND